MLFDFLLNLRQGKTKQSPRARKSLETTQSTEERQHSGQLCKPNQRCLQDWNMVHQVHSSVHGCFLLLGFKCRRLITTIDHVVLCLEGPLHANIHRIPRQLGRKLIQESLLHRDDGHVSQRVTHWYSNGQSHHPARWFILAVVVEASAAFEASDAQRSNYKPLI